MSTTYIVLRSNLPLSNNQFQFPLIADKVTSTAHCTALLISVEILKFK